jgi:Tfp pilus assembly protein PilF
MNSSVVAGSTLRSAHGALRSLGARGVFSALGVLLCAAPAFAQSVQYTSPAGVEYRAQADTGPIARAQAALDADARNPQKFIALAVAQSGARQFREAIATLTKGLEVAPNDAMLLRWRGHRYISVREFAKARADLTRGFALDSTNYGILYHFGVLNFIEGDFAGAAAMFTRSQPRAPDGGERAGSTDWLWMSLSRAGKQADAAAMLARHPDSLPTPPNYAYVTRLKLYRGELTPATLFGVSDTTDVQVATLNYGLGDWYMVRGDTVNAKAAFTRAVASGGWPGFGFIVSEAELKRMGKK